MGPHRMHQQVVAIAELSSSDEIPSLIAFRRTLARAMKASGRIAEAEQTLLKTVKVCETAYPPTSLIRVRSQLILARAHYANLNMEFAKGVLRDLEEVKKVLAEKERAESESLQIEAHSRKA